MKGLILNLMFFSVLGLSAQNIEVVSRSMNLGNAFENNASTTQVTVYNPGIFPVEITDVDLFEIYGDIPFTVSDTAFILMPQDTQSFTVSFLPEHNIMHSTALILKTNSGFGHVPVQLSGQGKYSNTYYSATENMEEEALKGALKTKLAQGYNSLGYTSARDNMYSAIDNSGGTVECVYTGRTANFTTRAGANSNSFNCEHTFPQGFFNQNEPMRSDIHHLFPTDVTSNSKRGNDPFGVVTNASWQVGGSKSGGNTFEPRDVHKGACARAMMYFVIRYQDYSNHFSGQESILRAWHNTYKPSAAEQSRNNQIAALQTSRNPFVDYPQFEERITSFVSNSVAPTVNSLYYSDDTIRLRPSAGRFEYEFVFYNNGNQTVNLSNFTLSDTSLHFEPGPVLTLTIPPGDAATVRISYESSNTYLATLGFDTDIPGQPSKMVPINSTAKIGVEESVVTTQHFNLYPNPAQETVFLDVAEEQISFVDILDISGLMRKVVVQNGQVDIASLPVGLYFVRVTTESGKIMIRKLLKE
ncbi:MAG: endonuclease [Owenweeksia sp.]